MPQLVDVTLDQYIEELIKLRAENPGSGQWPVEKWLPSRGRHPAPLPQPAFRLARKILQGQRTMMLPTAFWQAGHDRPEDRGGAVVRV
jgi:hypothetical protein